MCCLWYHFSVLQPLQFVVLLATFSAVASESGAQHRYDFFCFEICALLAIGPPLNSIYHHPLSMCLEHHDFVAPAVANFIYQKNFRIMGPKDWDWTRWKIATWAAQEHETNHEADINRFKQIQTSNTKKSVLLHFLLGMIAACYCLFPGPDLGDAKNLAFDEAGAMPNPNFECKLVELIPFKIYALHFWTGMSRLATGTQLNPTSSLIFCDWSFLEEKHIFKKHKFLKGRLLRSKCCVCQKQCICSHTYSS